MVLVPPPHVRRPMVYAVAGALTAYLIYFGFALATASHQQKIQPVFAFVQRTHSLSTWGFISIVGGVLLPFVFHKVLWPGGLAGVCVSIYVQVYFAETYVNAQQVAHVGKAGVGAPTFFAVVLLMAAGATLNEHLFGPVNWKRWRRRWGG
jgi:hypothetical protein